METLKNTQIDRDHTQCRWYSHGENFGDPPVCAMYNRMARRAICEPCRNFELHPDFKEGGKDA